MITDLLHLLLFLLVGSGVAILTLAVLHLPTSGGD